MHNPLKLTNPCPCTAHLELQYSFMYREYKDSVCYWEFVTMGRKLAFLGIFVALTPPLLSSREMTALLQLLVAVILAVLSLLLNVLLRPFKQPELNRLERAALAAITLTFLLLAAAVTVSSSSGGKAALLVLAGVLNLGLLCYFVWHMGVLVWAGFGQGLMRAMQQRRVARARQRQRPKLPTNVAC